uniref:Uncharacterized protein n=1 Tax=Cacopsylla melanoneura TaxID=428564 RepID=A0A8D8VUG5_9HEMI
MYLFPSTRFIIIPILFSRSPSSPSDKCTSSTQPALLSSLYYSAEPPPLQVTNVPLPASPQPALFSSLYYLAKVEAKFPKGNFYRNFSICRLVFYCAAGNVQLHKVVDNSRPGVCRYQTEGKRKMI